MSKTFFFYDLETSGLNPREDRIMQFAGQRTDLDLNKVSEPINVLVRLDDDVLPSPEAIMVTGITPQQTASDGYKEADFAKMLMNEVFTPDTIAVGYNNIRFDDEFIRHLFWRNFFDPYEWSYKEGRSRWDLLDVIRLTRALRPEGIEWPVDADGKATNRLELITKQNGINHFKAHDAMSDVEALIAVAGLIKDKQNQLFDYLLRMRDKNEVKKLVNLDTKMPFVYVSGRYESEYNKATVAFPLTAGKNGNVIVYDLRYDPKEFIGLNTESLKKSINANWSERQQENYIKVPVKELQYNRTPAVAPISVLSSGDGWKNLNLDQENVIHNKNVLLSAPDFAENIRSIFESRDDFVKSNDPECQLYDGFVPDVDKMRIERVRGLNSDELADLHPNFIDERLAGLFLHYKARNFPNSLSQAESVEWEKWRGLRIKKAIPSYLETIEKLSGSISDNKRLFILQELQLWAESVMPGDEDSQLSLVD